MKLQRSHYAVFFSIVLGAFLLFIAFSSGYYPVALVDFSFIWAKDISYPYYAAVVYRSLSVSENNSQEYPLFTPSSPLELRVVNLNELINQKLIAAANRALLPADELRTRLDEVAHRAEQNNRAFALAQNFFNMTQQEFRTYVLDPRAEREVLRAELAKRGITFDDWLRAEKQHHRIWIFSSRLYWDGERVRFVTEE
ncbi:hypothetical protein D6779_01210 [Candidatus Parcubacteria bacterium]|nr:MAG: hypothetical protein D6779_01210 [Candidatus Parcubacteria bacterium]